MNHDVFISYPHEDQAIADAVCAKLEAHSINCWIAPRDIPPGTEWPKAIIDAIDHCRAVALIFSSNANSSRQIAREVQRAFEGGIPVVPFRIEKGSLAFYLSSVQGLDASTRPIEPHLQKLVDSVKVIVRTSRRREKRSETQ